MGPWGGGGRGCFGAGSSADRRTRERSSGRALARIIKAGNRASEVIDRIRALAKKSPTRKDRLNISEVILEVVALTRSEVQRNRISLRNQLSDNLPIIQGDRIQLHQVVLNLILNAFAAMAIGGGPLEVLVTS